MEEEKCQTWARSLLKPRKEVVITDFDDKPDSGVMSHIIRGLNHRHLYPQSQHGGKRYSVEIDGKGIQTEAAFCPQLNTKHSLAV